MKKATSYHRVYVRVPIEWWEQMDERRQRHVDGVMTQGGFIAWLAMTGLMKLENDDAHDMVGLTKLKSDDARDRVRLMELESDDARNPDGKLPH